MTSRRAITVRLPGETHRQLEELASRFGTKTAVVTVAVRDLYRAERPAPHPGSGDTLIVTRHAGLVEWLDRQGIRGRVIEHATADDVRGQHVVGALPLHLAALAASVTTVDMPGLRPEQRGVDLTPDEMDAAGATLRRYRVEEAGELWYRLFGGNGDKR